MTNVSPATALAGSLRDKLGTSDLANPAALAAVDGVLDALRQVWREEGERAGYQRFEDERKRRNDLLVKLAAHPAWATAAALIAALVLADRTELEIRVVLADIEGRLVGQAAASAAVALFAYGLTASEVAADLTQVI